MRKLLNISLIIIIVTIFSGFIIVDNFLLENRGKDLELPLSDINGIVVDSSGNIYIGLDYFGKVQVYDKNGVFIDSWDVKSNTGSFYIDIKENNILIYCDRGNFTYTHDHVGRILSKTTKEGARDPQIEKSQKSFRDDKGSEYMITGWLFPNIRKNGDIIIRQNIFLKIVTFPDGLFIVVLCLILLIIVNRNIIKGQLFPRH